MIAPLPSNPCALCKRVMGKSCCEPSVNDDGWWSPMTFNEATRLAQMTGWPLERAVVVLDVSPKVVAELAKQYSKREAEQVIDGVGFFLGRPGVGRKCRYLERSGCAFSNERKPHTCALYPFERSPRSGDWWIYNYPHHNCVVQQVACGDVDKGLRAFDMKSSQLNTIWKRWDADRATHAAQMREWIATCYRSSKAPR